VGSQENVIIDTTAIHVEKVEITGENQTIVAGEIIVEKKSEIIDSIINNAEIRKPIIPITVTKNIHMSNPSLNIRYPGVSTTNFPY
jgi:ApbE superfamily uncharacterized protein (UPF0280 family)